MHKRRLLKLADLLEADAKNKKGIRFDLLSWGHVNDPDEVLSCDTTACAMGLAAVSGVFRRQGLKCRIRKGVINIGFGRSWDAMKATQRIFQITRDDTHDLFITAWNLPAISGAEGERAVAKRIRDFVAAH